MSSAAYIHPGFTFAQSKNLVYAQPYHPDAGRVAADANTLHKALKEGWFTNEDGVFGVLCKRTATQIADIRRVYNTQFSADLLEDVKKHTSGHFEDLVKALVMSPAEYDAYRIHRAIEGITTNEDQLMEILCHREVYEVRAFNESYQTMFGTTAHAALEKAVSGELGLLFSFLSNPNNDRRAPMNEDNQVTTDVQTLYDASQGKLIGHHSEPFIRVLGLNNKEYIHRVYNAYANKHGKTLEHIINSWPLGGHLAKAMLAIVTPPAEWYSTLLYLAMKGAGTDENRLIRLIVTQRERYLPQVADHFLHTYKKTLKEWVKDETSGDFKNSLVTLLEYYADAKV